MQDPGFTVSHRAFGNRCGLKVGVVAGFRVSMALFTIRLWVSRATVKPEP